jgi:thioredoxin reductase
MAIGSEVEHWDVVIVGAGIAGLSSVGFLLLNTSR